jgi:cytosine/adenosine deaminase-related metal-dependent hydrolase
MPSYIVYAREANTMRADRRNTIVVNAADAETARAAAEDLIGPAAGALANFAVVDIASTPIFVVRGHQPTRGVTGEVL